MNERHSFFGTPGPGARQRRLVWLVVAMTVAFVGVAIAKPWGASVPPSREARASRTASSVPSTVTVGPTAASSPLAATLGPLPAAFTAPFTTPVPPPADAAWSGLHWRRLAPDDPLSLVTSVVRWRGGFLAVGWSDAGGPSTPIWVSTDGWHWDPVRASTGPTFGRGALVIDAAAVPSGLVALTETARDCRVPPCAVAYDPPVVSWTSSDGRTWTPHPLPTPARLTGGAPRFAGGPAGVVVASSGPGVAAAVSPDGVDWRSLPVGAIPTTVILNDLGGTAAGYVAAGLRVTSDFHWDAVALWSADGKRWSRMPTLLPTRATAGTGVESVALSVIAGRDGLIVVGRDVAEPGAALWWWSQDGRRWVPLPSLPPLGPAPCPSAVRCTLEPNGSIAGDGQRLVAVRGGADAAAWVSPDGRTWTRLSVSGDIPGEGATIATLLPGGVLVSDRSMTWFGEGIVR